MVVQNLREGGGKLLLRIASGSPNAIQGFRAYGAFRMSQATSKPGDGLYHLNMKQGQPRGLNLTVTLAQRGKSEMFRQGAARFQLAGIIPPSSGYVGSRMMFFFLP